MSKLRKAKWQNQWQRRNREGAHRCWPGFGCWNTGLLKTNMNEEADDPVQRRNQNNWVATKLRQTKEWTRSVRHIQRDDGSFLLEADVSANMSIQQWRSIQREHACFGLIFIRFLLSHSDKLMYVAIQFVMNKCTIPRHMSCDRTLVGRHTGISEVIQNTPYRLFSLPPPTHRNRTLHNLSEPDELL